MPKAIKRRVQTKTSDTEQEVKDRLTIIKDNIKERKKTAYQAGIIIVVLIAALTGFFIYNHTSQKKAARLAQEASLIYYSEIPGQPAEDRYKKALEMFRQANNTKASPASLFYIAGCLYELGKYDEALSTLLDFTRKYANEDKYIPLAYQKIAMVHLKKGDEPGAMKALDTLSGLKGSIYKDFVLLEQARLLEKSGKTEEAKKKYKDLADKFPDSPFSGEAKAKLSEKKEG
jgi:predicted negative regulator of RcsB-dependent stress response